MSGSAKERFEKIRDRYDGIYDRFVEFHLSPLGREHEECLSDFIHETNGLAQKLGRALLDSETLPSRGELNVLWSHEHNLLTHVGIMELILALASACGPDGIREGYRGDLRRAPVRSTSGCYGASGRGWFS